MKRSAISQDKQQSHGWREASKALAESEFSKLPSLLILLMPVTTSTSVD
jgi:hypothetical protein